MTKNASPICGFASTGQISALPKSDTKIEAAEAIQEAIAVQEPITVQLNSTVNHQYAPDTSWAAYKVFIALVFSEALLFGWCSVVALCV